jgi:hypothetical protein
MIRCKGKDIKASRKEYRPDKPPDIIYVFFHKYEFKVQNLGDSTITPKSGGIEG